MSRFIDLTGKVFGELTVSKFVGGIYYKWECICNCGKVVFVPGGLLRSGKKNYCGCKTFKKQIQAQEERPGSGNRTGNRKGVKLSEETRSKIGEAHRGEKCALWKGGVSELKVCLFDTYAHQLEPVEICRRNPDDNRLLQVKCTYCGKWISPTPQQAQNRIGYLEGKRGKESRFYCKNDSCKSSCPIYNRTLYPKGFKNGSSREVPAELRHAVFGRDNYTCQRCGSTQYLNCHHILPATQNPIFSADPESCITLCRTCHKAAHSDPGCRYVDLRCPDPQPPIELSI